MIGNWGYYIVFIILLDKALWSNEPYTVQHASECPSLFGLPAKFPGNLGPGLGFERLGFSAASI